MSDQSQSAGPDDLAEKPVIGGEGKEPQPDTELDNPVIGEGGENPDGDGEDDLDELEFGYKKWRVPKELKAGVEKLNSSFTQLNQEQSSKASELAAREERIAEQHKATEDEMLARVSLSNIKSRIDEYEKLTTAQWNEMKETNYEAWNEHRLNVITLHNARADAEKKLSEFDGKRSEAASKDYQTRIQQTQAFAEKLPGWTTDLDKQVVQFALEKGLTPKQINENMSPALYDTLRLARIGADLLKRQAAAAKAKPDTSPEPLEMVGAKKSPPPAGLDDKLPIGEWMKVREKQLKAKAH